MAPVKLKNLPKKSSWLPCRALWQTCLKNRPKPRTPRTSLSRETASSTELSSSWSQMSKWSTSEDISSMSLLNNLKECKTKYWVKFGIKYLQANLKQQIGEYKLDLVLSCIQVFLLATIVCGLMYTQVFQEIWRKMNNKNENSRFRYKAFVIINSGCKQYGVNILKQQKIEKLFFSF